ncbi:MAG: hypothetical protein WDO24_27415 [Pseudomonadota bacterium]
MLWIGIVVALIGIALMLAQPLPLVILGLAVVTTGFFGRAFGRQLVGRASGAPRQGASRLDLSVRLLFRSERNGLARRLRLVPWRLARRDRAARRGHAGRARHWPAPVIAAALATSDVT